MSAAPEVMDLFAGVLILWGGVLAFVQPLRHRPHFWLRTVGCLAVSVLAELLRCALGASRATLILTGPLFYLIICAMVLFCAQLTPDGVAYAGVWCFLTGLLSFELHELSLGMPVAALMLPLLFELTVWATLGRSLPVGGSYRVGPRQLLSALLLFGLFAGAYITLLWDEIPPTVSGWAGVLVLQLYLGTILYLQSALFRKSALQQEVNTLNLLRHQQQTRYEMARADVELINRKCHDLKHQVAALRAMDDSAAREPYLQEIETLVEQYDAIVKTGNDVLDTILTQKSRYAEAQHIRINCVAEGSATAFMDAVDLYTLLGNALDNAIEYVKGAGESEKRIVDVLVHTRQRFLAITITNPLHSVPVFRDGLPITTKAKNGYHGYGIKSIRHIAEKYGGYLTLDTAADTFTLRVLIPLPEGTV